MSDNNLQFKMPGLAKEIKFQIFPIFNFDTPIL